MAAPTSWDRAPSAPDSPGRPGSGGPGAGPSPPALWFQCLEAAAACTSLTWAAVKRPPGAPRRCPCRPWAASSWRWSAEPSTCPTGKCGLLGGPGDPAQPTSAVSTVSVALDPSVLSSSLCDWLCYPRAAGGPAARGPGAQRWVSEPTRGAPGTALVQLEALLPPSSPIAAPTPSSPPAPFPGPQPLSLAPRPPGSTGSPHCCGRRWPLPTAAPP